MALLSRGSPLGRGLGALLPAASGLTEIEIDSIVRNPRQPRQRIDQEALEELANSIRAHGLLQPLVVREAPGMAGRKYELIAGERRWQASKLVGLARVPAVVKDVTPQATLELALVENIQRADLSALEEAQAYKQLIDEFDLTHEAVSERVGKSRVAVTNALRLLGLPAPVKNALAAGEITEGHARGLLGLPDDAARALALKRVKNLRLTVRQTEELVRNWGLLRPRRAASVDGTLETRALEEQFRSALGTKVALRRKRRGGTLTIHFYSDEELQGLYEVLISSRS